MALFDGVLGANALGRVRLWNKRWFKSPKDVAVKVAAGGREVAGNSFAWGTACGGLALGLEKDTLLRTACTLLNIRKLPGKPSAADLRLLHAVSEACIRDLLSEVVAGLRLSKEVSAIALPAFRELGREAVMRLVISIPILSKSIEVYLDQDVAVSARKAQMAPAREPRTLGAMKSAVDAQEINVGACIGWGRAPLAELSSLEPDDVLILDEALGKDLALLINGRRTSDPGIELVQTGSTLALRERKAGSRAA
jgi:flagellar motor switch/type III secretory pathway protein FliN